MLTLIAAPSKVKINCSKFIIAGLQQRCNTTSLVSLFVISFFICNIENLTVWCISTKQNYYNLTKNNHKFQASFTERYTSLSKSSGIIRQNPLKAPTKKLNLQKSFTTNELLHQWLLMFPARFFLTIYRSLFVAYADTFCIRIYICKKFFLPPLLFLR